MKANIRILIADDHPLLRAGIGATIAHQPDFTIIGEATTGQETLDRCKALQPDVVLLDLNLPGPTFAEVIATLQKCCPAVHIIAVTAYDDVAYVHTCIAAHIAGYVLKDEAVETLESAIRVVMQGGQWYSRGVVEALTKPAPMPERQVESAGLTARELNVLNLLIEGKTNQQIGRALAISTKTVEKHLAALFKKLGVGSRVEAAVYGVRAGIKPSS